MTIRGEYLQNTLTIDPGEHTGWAYWNGLGVPEEVGQFNSTITKACVTPENQVKQIREEFCLLNTKFKGLKHVYVEGVEYLDSDVGDVISTKRGNLKKLSLRIEIYTKICQELGLDITLISANRWKGQMDTDAVTLRVYRSIQRHYPQPNMTNAVGMGLSIMGRL